MAASWDDFAPVLPQQGAARQTPAPVAASGWEQFRPVAELRNVPPGTRIGGTTTIQDSPETGARIGSNVLASMAPDERGQIKILSRQMGIPETRFGVIDGNIVYQMEDGRLARAVPSVTGATGPLDALKRGANWLASQFGPSLPGLAGGAAGIATAPFGGGIPGAAVTAGAVDTMRQGVANQLAGRDLTDINYANVAGQSALAGAGQGIAAGINRLASRNPMQIGAYDRADALNPQTLAEAQARQAQAQAQGTNLTFGQATGLRSALSGERQLSRDPASMDTMQRTYETQRGDMRRMVGGFADQVSPVASAEQGARALREGAANTIDTFKRARRAEAGPLFREAFENNLAVDSSVLKEIERTPAGQEAFRRAVVKMQNSRDRVGVTDKELTALAREAGLADGNPVPRSGVASGLKLEFWDYFRRSLADMEKEAMRAGRDDDLRIFGDLRRAVRGQLTALDRTAAAGPNSLKPEGGAYERALDAYRARSPEIDALERGPAGRLAAREGVETARDLSPMFDFRQVGPQAVAQNRAAFEKAGQMDQWNAGLSTYIRDQLAAANGSPKMFLNRVWGNEANQREREVLQAAMTPVQWQGFRTLMQTLERFALTLPEGSPTATDMAGGQALRDQFAGVGRMIGRLTSPSRALDIGGAVGDRVALRMSDEGMAKLAQAVTDPNNVEALKRLRMMGPGSKAATSVATQIMGGSLVGVFGGRTPDDFAPPSLSAMTTSR